VDPTSKAKRGGKGRKEVWERRKRGRVGEGDKKKGGQLGIKVETPPPSINSFACPWTKSWLRLGTKISFGFGFSLETKSFRNLKTFASVITDQSILHF